MGTGMREAARILVVEDDNDISALLCGWLRDGGYEVQPAFSGTEAKLYLDMKEWDLVLLDLMLPGLRGEELLGELGADGRCPVIVVTAEGGRQTKLSALRTGADDYITKPFDLEEVAARVESVLRRYRRLPAETAVRRLCHKDLALDPDARSVTVADRPVSLTAREYEILLVLLSSPKKLFTKANLFESVWGEDFLGGEENTVNVHMSNLRSKLAKANPDEEYVETIWGMGYRLKA